MEELDWSLAKTDSESPMLSSFQCTDSSKFNICRSFILPIVYGAFLAYAQLFFNKPDKVREH